MKVSPRGFDIAILTLFEVRSGSEHVKYEQVCNLVLNSYSPMSNGAHAQASAMLDIFADYDWERGWSRRLKQERKRELELELKRERERKHEQEREQERYWQERRREIVKVKVQARRSALLERQPRRGAKRLMVRFRKQHSLLKDVTMRDVLLMKKKNLHFFREYLWLAS